MGILDNLEEWLDFEEEVDKDPELTSGFGYDELKDFDMGYKDRPKSRITPFMGTNR